MPAHDDVRHAKATLSQRLKHVAGVTSLGIGKSRGSGRYVVRVTVLDGNTAKLVPPQCEGVPVEVSVSGTFRAQ